jgi:hypothetical protein
MSTINPCTRPGHRENLFARALAMLKLGKTQAEIEAFFEGKNLTGKYVTLDGKILPNEHSRYTAWDLLQKLSKGDTQSIPKVTETIVTNHNKDVIKSWTEAGLGDIVSLDGLKIFQPNINFKGGDTTWDFQGAHGDLAALKTGKGGDKSLLIVDRNLWQTRGLTHALEEAAKLAPPELQEVYRQAARTTVTYLKTGRIEKRLQDADAVEAPEWSKSNPLAEAKGVQASTKAVDTYLKTQLAKAAKSGKEPEINPKTLLQRFSDKTSGGFLAIKSLLSPKTIQDLEVTVNPTSLADPRIVLDPAAENLGEQLARELLLAEVTSRLGELLATKRSIRQLISKAPRKFPQRISEAEALRMILRDPQLKAELDAALRIKEWAQADTILWNLKTELATGGGHTPLSKQLDTFWKETKLEERPPEPEPEVDFTAELLSEVDEYHAGAEDVPPMPDYLLEEDGVLGQREEDIPFWEETAPIIETREKFKSEVLEPLPEHISLAEEVTGSQTSLPIELTSDPTAQWTNAGQPTNPELVNHMLNQVVWLQNQPEMLTLLKRIPHLKDAEIIDHLIASIRASNPNNARILADYVSLWRGPKEFQTLENFDTALKPCR